jgi:hypothetical protein
LFEREVLASEIAIGRGLASVGYGKVPVPAPATLEILRGKPISGKQVDAELTTPTGAALLTTLATKFVRAYPTMRIDAVGYGAGTRKLPTPNLVRVCLGETSKAELKFEEIVTLETNLDDVSGEVVGFVMEKLLVKGALDVRVTPTQMKKGRPGFAIQTLAKPADAERLARLLMLHTGTLGVRVLPTRRYVLKRRVVPIKLKLGERGFKARVKLALDHGRIVGLAAEYEDARRIAERTGFGIREIMVRIEEAARRGIRATRG